MPRYNRYYPDYEKIYPGIEKRPDILRVLRASDRKMRYMEIGLKSERFVTDPENQTVVFLPGRETSLEQLAEDEQRQFSDGSKRMSRYNTKRNCTSYARLCTVWIKNISCYFIIATGKT